MYQQYTDQILGHDIYGGKLHFSFSDYLHQQKLLYDNIFLPQKISTMVNFYESKFYDHIYQNLSRISLKLLGVQSQVSISFSKTTCNKKCT